MPTTDGRPPGRTTIVLAFLAVAALSALLLAGPRDFTHGVRLLYAGVAAAIALLTVFVIASRAGRATDDALNRRHVTWVAAACVVGLGAVVAALALPPSAEKPAVEEPPSAEAIIDAGPVADAGSAVETPPKEHAPKIAGSGDLDRDIASAGVALGRGDLEEAARGFRDATERARAAGLDDRRLTASMGLGESLLSAGKPEEALETITAVRSWAEGAFDTPPADLVRLMVIEATARGLTKELTAATELLEQAITLADRHHPDDVELRGAAVGSLIDTLMIQGQHDKALAAVDAHLARLRGAPRPDDAEIAAWLDTSGRVLGAAKRYAESATRLKESLALLRATDSPDPVRVALTQSSLALSLWSSGKKAEAKRLLGESRAVLEARLPEEHPARERIKALATEMGLATP